MAKRVKDTRAETEHMLAQVGVTVTDGGKARARAKLEAAERRMTPQEWARLAKRYRRSDAA